jgi:CHAT domain-containing protein/tetratricopeptide (TPR) repeat protein
MHCRWITALTAALVLAAPAAWAAPSLGDGTIDAYLPELNRLFAAGDWRGVERAARTALAEIEARQGPTALDTGGAASWLGVAFEQQARFGEAETMERRALGIFEARLGPDDPATTQVRMVLAQVLGDQGRDAEAEPLGRQVLSAFEKNGAPPYPAVANALTQLAGNLYSEGRFTEAEQLRRRALSITEGAAGPDAPQTARALTDVAIVLTQEDRDAEAEPLLRRALAIDDKADAADPGRDQEGAAVALLSLTDVLGAQRRFAEAEPLVRRALAIEEKTFGPSHPNVANDLSTLALVLDNEDRPAEAAPLAARAEAIFEASFGPRHPATTNSLIALAVNRVKLGRDGEAVDALRRACRGDAGGREAVTASHASKLTADQYANTCTLWLSLALRRWSDKGGGPAAEDQPQMLAEQAFRTAQAATTPTAGEAMAQAAAQALADKQGVGGQAQAYEAALKTLDGLDQSFAQVAGGADPDSRARQQALAAERGKTQAQITALQAMLKAKAPQYWDYRAPKALGVAELQAVTGEDAKLLRPNEAVVLWLVAPDTGKGLVFAVSKTGFAWARMGLTGDEVADKVTTLRYLIDPATAGRGGQGSSRGPARPAIRGAGREEHAHVEVFDRAAAHDLYVALLGDPKIQAVINGPGIDTLIVTPSGALTSLPPSLLVVDPPQGSNDDPAAMAATHWLIRDKALAVLPQVSSLRTLRQLLPASRRAPDLKLLALADPDFAGSGVIPQPPAPGQTLAPASPARDALAGLPPLYGTLTEGRALAALLDPGSPADLLLGPDASKANLMRRAADGTLARTQVIAFSTHGLQAHDLPGLNEPALALAHPPGDAGVLDGGLVKASDAAGLTLNADWVVLSACNTAAGDGGGSDGLSGLARAFFHAGASSLLVSHWRVEDLATPRLIVETFRVYQEGKTSKAQALRRSMLAMIDDPDHHYADPRYWAPFVLVGETR